MLSIQIKAQSITEGWTDRWMDRWEKPVGVAYPRQNTVEPRFLDSAVNGNPPLVIHMLRSQIFLAFNSRWITSTHLAVNRLYQSNVLVSKELKLFLSGEPTVAHRGEAPES